jgi:hypothetical protein
MQYQFCCQSCLDNQRQNGQVSRLDARSCLGPGTTGVVKTGFSCQPALIMAQCPDRTPRSIDRLTDASPFLVQITYLHCQLAVECEGKLTSTQHFQQLLLPNGAILSVQIYLSASCSILTADCSPKNYAIEVHSLVKHVTGNYHRFIDSNLPGSTSYHHQ